MARPRMARCSPSSSLVSFTHPLLNVAIRLKGTRRRARPYSTIADSTEQAWMGQSHSRPKLQRSSAHAAYPHNWDNLVKFRPVDTSYTMPQPGHRALARSLASSLSKKALPLTPRTPSVPSFEPDPPTLDSQPSTPPPYATDPPAHSSRSWSPPSFENHQGQQHHASTLPIRSVRHPARKLPHSVTVKQHRTPRLPSLDITGSPLQWGDDFCEPEGGRGRSPRRSQRSVTPRESWRAREKRTLSRTGRRKLVEEQPVAEVIAAVPQIVVEAEESEGEVAQDEETEVAAEERAVSEVATSAASRTNGGATSDITLLSRPVWNQLLANTPTAHTLKPNAEMIFLSNLPLPGQQSDPASLERYDDDTSDYAFEPPATTRDGHVPAIPYGAVPPSPFVELDSSLSLHQAVRRTVPNHGAATELVVLDRTRRRLTEPDMPSVDSIPAATTSVPDQLHPGRDDIAADPDATPRLSSIDPLATPRPRSYRPSSALVKMKSPSPNLSDAYEDAYEAWNGWVPSFTTTTQAAPVYHDPVPSSSEGCESYSVPAYAHDVPELPELESDDDDTRSEDITEPTDSGGHCDDDLYHAFSPHAPPLKKEADRVPVVHDDSEKIVVEESDYYLLHPELQPKFWGVCRGLGRPPPPPSESEEEELGVTWRRNPDSRTDECDRFYGVIETWGEIEFENYRRARAARAERWWSRPGMITEKTTDRHRAEATGPKLVDGDSFPLSPYGSPRTEQRRAEVERAKGRGGVAVAMDPMAGTITDKIKDRHRAETKALRQKLLDQNPFKTVESSPWRGDDEILAWLHAQRGRTDHIADLVDCRN
jgi:hypothetical protein